MTMVTILDNGYIGQKLHFWVIINLEPGREVTFCVRLEL